MGLSKQVISTIITEVFMNRFYSMLLLISMAGVQASENKYTVPEGVSLANVFAALYGNAKVLGMGKHAPNSGKGFSSAVNAMQVFSAYCPRGYCNYVRGKVMKVDFSKYPQLDLRSYNRDNGKNAGQKAIELYAQKADKIDSDNEHTKVPSGCEYFQEELWRAVPSDDRFDMQEQADRCSEMQHHMKWFLQYAMQEHGKKLFGDCNDCRVDYAIQSPPINYISHQNKPIKEARDHFKLLNNPRHNDSRIAPLKIWCADQGPRMELQLDALSIPDAEDVLNRIIEVTPSPA